MIIRHVEGPHQWKAPYYEKNEYISSQLFHKTRTIGNTSRSVTVSRVAELENENLRAVMLNCFKDINLNIYDQDIKIERIGIYDKKTTLSTSCKNLVH